MINPANGIISPEAILAAFSSAGATNMASPKSAPLPASLEVLAHTRTLQIYQGCQFHELAFAGRPMTLVGSDAAHFGAAVREANIRINILAHTKSLLYYWIYALFLIGRDEPDAPAAKKSRTGARARPPRPICITLFSDKQTFDNWKTPDAFLSGQSPAKDTNYLIDLQKKYSEGGQLDPQAFYAEDARFLTGKGVRIFMVHSADPLMTGVGAKRAVINMAMATAGGKPNFHGMTLDDNVSGIFEIQDAKKKRSVYERNICNGDTTDIKPTLLASNKMSILQVYQHLEGLMGRDVWMVGVIKGAGLSGGQVCDEKCIADGKTRYKPSSAIYKMALLNYAELEGAGVRYNPFFTMFLEDLDFNNKIWEKTQQDTHLYLRFGHFISKDVPVPEPEPEQTKIIKGKTEKKVIDFEDCLITDPDKLKTPISAPPMYLMYIKFLYQMGIHSQNIMHGFPLNINSGGKYRANHFITLMFYFYFLKLQHPTKFIEMFETLMERPEEVAYRIIQPGVGFFYVPCNSLQKISSEPPNNRTKNEAIEMAKYLEVYPELLQKMQVLLQEEYDTIGGEIYVPHKEKQDLEKRFNNIYRIVPSVISSSTLLDHLIEEQNCGFKRPVRIRTQVHNYPPSAKTLKRQRTPTPEAEPPAPKFNLGTTVKKTARTARTQRQRSRPFRRS